MQDDMEIRNVRPTYRHAVYLIQTMIGLDWCAMIGCAGKYGNIGIVFKTGERIYIAFDVVLRLKSPYIVCVEFEMVLRCCLEDI